MTALLLIALSAEFSVNPPVNGEYSFSNPSSSWSDECRASTYVKTISWQGLAVARVLTVSFAENHTSRGPLCFPMAVPSVLQSENYRDWLVMTTNSSQ